MTTLSRKELLELAQQNTDKGGVRELITAIAEARGRQIAATVDLNLFAIQAMQIKEAGNYYDAGAVLKFAAAYESASATLTSDFLTLASVLQNAGLSVDY